MKDVTTFDEEVSVTNAIQSDENKQKALTSGYFKPTTMRGIPLASLTPSSEIRGFYITRSEDDPASSISTDSSTPAYTRADVFVKQQPNLTETISLISDISMTEPTIVAHRDRIELKSNIFNDNENNIVSNSYITSSTIPMRRRTTLAANKHSEVTTPLWSGKRIVVRRRNRTTVSPVKNTRIRQTETDYSINAATNTLRNASVSTDYSASTLSLRRRKLISTIPTVSSIVPNFTSPEILGVYDTSANFNDTVVDNLKINTPTEIIPTTNEMIPMVPAVGNAPVTTTPSVESIGSETTSLNNFPTDNSTVNDSAATSTLASTDIETTSVTTNYFTTSISDTTTNVQQIGIDSANTTTVDTTSVNIDAISIIEDYSTTVIPTTVNMHDAITNAISITDANAEVDETLSTIENYSAFTTKAIESTTIPITTTIPISTALSPLTTIISTTENMQHINATVPMTTNNVTDTNTVTADMTTTPLSIIIPTITDFNAITTSDYANIPSVINKPSITTQSKTISTSSAVPLTSTAESSTIYSVNLNKLDINDNFEALAVTTTESAQTAKIRTTLKIIEKQDQTTSKLDTSNHRFNQKTARRRVLNRTNNWLGSPLTLQRTNQNSRHRVTHRGRSRRPSPYISSSKIIEKNVESHLEEKNLIKEVNISSDSNNTNFQDNLSKNPYIDEKLSDKGTTKRRMRVVLKSIRSKPEENNSTIKETNMKNDSINLQNDLLNNVNMNQNFSNEEIVRRRMRVILKRVKSKSQVHTEDDLTNESLQGTFSNNFYSAKNHPDEYRTRRRMRVVLKSIKPKSEENNSTIEETNVDSNSTNENFQSTLLNNSRRDKNPVEHRTKRRMRVILKSIKPKSKEEDLVPEETSVDSDFAKNHSQVFYTVHFSSNPSIDDDHLNKEKKRKLEEKETMTEWPEDMEAQTTRMSVPVEQDTDSLEVTSNRLISRNPGNEYSNGHRKPVPFTTNAPLTNTLSNTLPVHQRRRPVETTLSSRIDFVAFEDTEPYAKSTAVLQDQNADVSDQSIHAQEFEVMLSDPPPLSSNIGQTALRDIDRRKISTTVAPRTDPTISRTASRYDLNFRSRQKPRAKDGPTVNATTRPRRPPVIDYDYYEDEAPIIVNKSVLSSKLFLTNKGTIRCLDQGNFPHPYSCKKFITCARMVNGQVIGTEYTCPDRLSFDPIGGICNWSAGLGCKD